MLPTGGLGKCGVRPGRRNAPRKGADRARLGSAGSSEAARGLGFPRRLAPEHAGVVGGDPAARWERGPSESHSWERRCFPKLSNVSKGQHLFKNRLCPDYPSSCPDRREGAAAGPARSLAVILTLRGSPRLRGSAASLGRAACCRQRPTSGVPCG